MGILFYSLSLSGCVFLYVGSSLENKFVDSKTGEPIDGVIVVRSWTKQHATPAGSISEFKSYKEKISDQKGNVYFYPKVIPYIFINPVTFFFGDIFSIVEENPVIAYHPGYKFFESKKDGLRKNRIIQLESLPYTYYPRYEVLEDVKGQHEVDWQITSLLKETINNEEKHIRLLDRYPDGVIFKGFTDEKEYLIGAYDIAVDRDYIYIGDGGFPMRLVKITNNGEWIIDSKIWVRGSNSGGNIGVGLTKDGRLWVTARECLKEFITIERTYLQTTDLNCSNPKNENLYSTNYYHRFHIDKNNNLHLITIEGKLPAGLYIIDKDGNVISKYIPTDKDMRLNDVVTNSAGNSYVTFTVFNYTISNKRSGGIAKFDKYAEPVKWLYLDNIRERFINIAIDKNEKVYLSLKDSFNVYDSDLNLMNSIDLKHPELGELEIIAIDVDKEGKYLYVIDSEYQRIIKYDLINRKLAANEIKR